MSAGSLPRAPCRPNPCKERWIVEENSNTKTIGACENHWSCCSEDDQCVLSVIQCKLEISDDTNLEQPFCEDRGISVMPNDNCDITVDVSNIHEGIIGYKSIYASRCVPFPLQVYISHVNPPVKAQISSYTVFTQFIIFTANYLCPPTAHLRWAV